MNTCCSFILRDLETGVIEDCTGRRIVHGPSLCTCFIPCVESYKLQPMVQLDPDEMMEVRHILEPAKSTWLSGPLMAQLDDPWAEFQPKQKSIILDQDDYIMVRDTKGQRTVHKNPGVYIPRDYGDVVDRKGNAVLCPVNHYLIINDSECIRAADGSENPVIHEKGPCKWYPKSFQSLTLAPNGDEYHPMITVSGDRAVHLQKANGEVVLLDKPAIFMPEVGAKVVNYVKLNVLLTNDFCIVKTPSGGVNIKLGTDENSRAFFLKPFEEFVTFEHGSPKDKKSILNTLPNIIPHNFHVRTPDNVVLTLDVRINYRVCDVSLFSANPIEFYSMIQNQVQNNFLDKFSEISLSQFMSSFGTVAESEVNTTNSYFNNFGIEIIALFILNYSCDNETTQQLLWADIHTTVKQQNELRARQTDVYIQEQVNMIMRKQKDLEVALVNRDNDIFLQKKKAENTLRIKEMEIEIQEESKRSELLELKRGNDLVEAEFEGKAKGHEFREFLEGVDPKMTKAQKIGIYNKQCDMKRTATLYSKANNMVVYPSEVEVETYQLGNAKDIHKIAKHTSQIENNGIKINRGKQRYEDMLRQREQEKASNDIMPGLANLQYDKSTVKVNIGNQFRDHYSNRNEDTVDIKKLDDEHWNQYQDINQNKYSNSSGSSSTSHNKPPPPPPPKKYVDVAEQTKRKESADRKYSHKLYSDAVAEYTQAIEYGELGSEISIKCINNRGLCQSKLNNINEAIADCTLSLQFSPDEPKILLRRFNLYKDQDMTGKAIIDARKLVSLGSNSVGSFSFKICEKFIASH